MPCGLRGVIPMPHPPSFCRSIRDKGTFLYIIYKKKGTFFSFVPNYEVFIVKSCKKTNKVTQLSGVVNEFTASGL